MTRKIDASLAGERFDRAVRQIWRGVSLRAARRLIADGTILLNEKIALPGRKLRIGDKLRGIELDGRKEAGPLARLLATDGDFVYFYKPADLHTALLAGRENPSLEKSLPSLLLGRGLTKVQLLQRLDFGTAGIVAGSATDSGAIFWREAEAQGQCRKFYYAALKGVLPGALCVKNALVCENRKLTQVLAEEAPRMGWTWLEPVAFGSGLTLARVCILKGQRHQIRAHTAWAGYPLAGDERYGGGAGSFVLEQYGLVFPGHEYFYLAPESGALRLFGGAARRLAEAGSCM